MGALLHGDSSAAFSGMGQALQHPFKFHWVHDTWLTIGSLEVIYIIAVYYYLETRKDYHRRGQEHGSAEWGDVKQIDARYRAHNPTGRKKGESIRDYYYRKKMERLDRQADTRWEPWNGETWKEHREKVKEYDRKKAFCPDNKIMTQNFQIGLDGHKHRRNLNTVVIGGSGAGKTRFYAKPNVLQANTSYVILDPKGELLRDTGYWLTKCGYRIKVLDLLNMDRSDHYNPFEYIQTDNDVQRLVDNLYKATTPKGSKSSDPFWDEAAKMMLSAIFFYLIYVCEPEDRNFANVLQMVSLADADEDKGSTSMFDQLFADLQDDNGNAKKPQYELPLKYYNLYHKGAGKTLQSIHITVAAHLEKFNLPALRELTMYDELDIDSMGEVKTALYCLIPDSDTSFNFVVSMLYTQLFQRLFYSADKLHGGALPIPVHFVMDEFANVALPDDFDKVLATMRSRNVYVSIILQNISQLKKLFKDEWESIMGNCDETLYLGGNEKDTFKYISEILGKETIDTTSNNQTHGEKGSYSTGYNNAGIDLMSPDEIRQLDNQYAILLVRGERPVLDKKFDIMTHPAIKFTPDSPDADHAKYNYVHYKTGLPIDFESDQQPDHRDDPQDSTGARLETSEKTITEENKKPKTAEELLTALKESQWAEEAGLEQSLDYIGPNFTNDDVIIKQQVIKPAES